MTTPFLDAPPSRTTGGPDLCHLTCCDDDIAMCGEDVTGTEWDDDAEDECPLCMFVKEQGLPCPVTGCARRTS